MSKKTKPKTDEHYLEREWRAQRDFATSVLADKDSTPADVQAAMRRLTEPSYDRGRLSRDFSELPYEIREDLLRVLKRIREWEQSVTA